MGSFNPGIHPTFTDFLFFQALLVVASLPMFTYFSFQLFYETFSIVPMDLG